MNNEYIWMATKLSTKEIVSCRVVTVLVAAKTLGNALDVAASSAMHERVRILSFKKADEAELVVGGATEAIGACAVDGEPRISNELNTQIVSEESQDMLTGGRKTPLHSSQYDFFLDRTRSTLSISRKQRSEDVGQVRIWWVTAFR